MKVQPLHFPGADKAPLHTRAPRRRSVATILREAYRRFSGDAVTRRAVRRALS